MRLYNDPKIHNLEWPFYEHLSCFAIKNRSRRLGYILIVELFIDFLYDVSSKDVRKQTAKLQSAEYCGSAKGLWIFRRRKVPGDTSSKP